MAYGNLALDLLLKGVSGRLVVLKNGHYGNVPLEVVTATKKIVNVKEHYNTERLRPQFTAIDGNPLFIVSGESI
jgi:6-phosphofructokinase 1